MIKKDIPGYAGLYYITEEGKVYSYDRLVESKGRNAGKRPRKGQLIASSAHSTNKQEVVQLFKQGRRKVMYVYLLMSDLFFNSKKVIHIDGDKMSNNILNLKLK